ncbi:hypothetical protein [Streptomyces klenkii]|uniref:hypothetical protein n=1 Tax=Streptomyces klenkii TaxID=1420899 RepID=UPI00344A2DB0
MTTRIVRCVKAAAVGALAGLRTLPRCLPTVITDAMAAVPGGGAVYLGDTYE